MADEEGSEDTLLDSILEEEGEEREQAEPEGEEEESAEQEGEEQETEEESEEGGEQTEASGPDDADESEEGEEEDGGERAQPSRAQSRIQRQAAENNRLRAENEELRRRYTGGGQGGGGNAQPQAPNPQAFRDNLKKGVQEKLGTDFALLQPDQQADRLLGAMETVLQPIVRGLQGNQFATSDKAQFYEDRRNNRWVEKNKAEIERRFHDAQSKGFTIPREQIARDMAGEQALSGIQKGGGSARRQAQNRKAAARGTPTRGRGDSTGKSRKNEMEQLEDRLKDVKI